MHYEVVTVRNNCHVHSKPMFLKLFQVIALNRLGAATLMIVAATLMIVQLFEYRE